MTGRRLYNLFKAAQAEGEEYEWIVKYKDVGIRILLDNDVTYIKFPHLPKDNDMFETTLTNCLGNEVGVYGLLGALGIEVEGA